MARSAAAKRKPKPHDALFKAVFGRPEHAAALFREVLPNSVSDAIAWETLTPKPGSFVDPDLADRHSDLLFSVQLGDAQALVYMLLEHQSTNDLHMPLRLLDYCVKIWLKERKPDSRLPLIIPW